MKASLGLPSGISQMLEDLAALGQDMDTAAETILEAGADVAVEGMRRRVRKDKGTLQDTLQKSPVVHDGNVALIEVGQLKRTPAREAIKASVHEFGSSSIEPQSFVRAAMNEDKAKIYGAMKKAAQEFGLGND